jgi:aminopeptidase N
VFVVDGEAYVLISSQTAHFPVFVRLLESNGCQVVVSEALTVEAETLVLESVQAALGLESEAPTALSLAVRSDIRKLLATNVSVQELELS